ncbi:unnamed protein product [Parascedosporium putredinis]|uniref:Uncharacterized protein n=1 Tax=Parascedosporium putredinis TaxID=1442378 RepID=A0A9P1MGM1_9PEZI|nr:unnamed protein product [Parascedosporium putredinis]CAI8004739.1 unnamed protein product [Parascedosporium putredinis]
MSASLVLRPIAARFTAPSALPTDSSRRPRAASLRLGPETRGKPGAPRFSLRSVASTPRGRAYLILGFGVLAGLETYAWTKFGPSILGWDKGEKA